MYVCLDIVEPWNPGALERTISRDHGSSRAPPGTSGSHLGDSAPRGGGCAVSSKQESHLLSQHHDQP